MKKNIFSSVVRLCVFLEEDKVCIILFMFSKCIVLWSKFTTKLKICLTTNFKNISTKML